MSKITGVAVAEINPELDFIILSNGAKWKFDKPDSIDCFIDNLAKYTLDPYFAINGIKSKLDLIIEKCTATQISFDGHYCYSGNFFDVSSIFRIWVKRGSALEIQLDKLITENLKTPAYQDALSEHGKEKYFK